MAFKIDLSRSLRRNRPATRMARVPVVRPGVETRPRHNAMTFMGRVRQIMNTPMGDGVVADEAAKAFVEQMKRGNFQHMQEYINREEGKVPSRMADAEGKNLKLYVGMPTEGEDAP